MWIAWISIGLSWIGFLSWLGWVGLDLPPPMARCKVAGNAELDSPSSRKKVMWLLRAGEGDGTGRVEGGGGAWTATGEGRYVRLPARTVWVPRCEMCQTSKISCRNEREGGSGIGTAGYIPRMPASGGSSVCWRPDRAFASSR